MKLLFVTGREPAYVRNAMLLAALQANGVELEDATDSSPAYPRRLAKVMAHFVSSLRSHGAELDGVFVGFFGQPLMQLIGRMTSKPILFDAFLSAYDTMCFDRKRFSPDSAAGRFFFYLDKYACERADRVLLDTNSYIDYFVETFGVPRQKFQRVLVGADERIFYPRERTRHDGKFQVFYYASYLPLHGTEYIVQAAHELRDHSEIEFVLVGKGPRKREVQELSARLKLQNIRFIEWLPFADLPQAMAEADVCLGGHFSNIDKGKRVIAGKTYQFIAMRKPVIVGDGPGNHELFEDGANALFVPTADPRGLAAGILRLQREPALAERIAAGGYETFLSHASFAAITREMADVLQAWRAAQPQLPR